MIDLPREHTHGRDCWCNPVMVEASTSVLAPHGGRIVRYDMIGVGRVAVHIEPNESQEASADE